MTGITTLGGYRVAGGLGLPGMDLLLQPGHTTADFPPSIVGGRSFGRIGNRVAGMATNTALEAMAGPARELRRELGLPRRGIRETLLGQPDQPLAGLLRLQPGCCAPPGGLARRLPGHRLLVAAAAGRVEPAGGAGGVPELSPPPVFFGFGDMTPENPGDFIEQAAEAGRRAGVRQVIQAGQASPAAADRLPAGDSIVIGDVPHDWLFPRMAALTLPLAEQAVSKAGQGRGHEGRPVSGPSPCRPRSTLTALCSTRRRLGPDKLQTHTNRQRLYAGHALQSELLTARRSRAGVSICAAGLRNQRSGKGRAGRGSFLRADWPSASGGYRRPVTTARAVTGTARPAATCPHPSLLE